MIATLQTASVAVSCLRFRPASDFAVVAGGTIGYCAVNGGVTV